VSKVNVYLNFAGNAEEAFNFYKSVFGGEFTSVVRFKDMPMEGGKLNKEEEDRLMHIALPIGKDFLLMASDCPEFMLPTFVTGNNVFVTIHAESKEEADRVFNTLSAGGNVKIPIKDQVWGDYFGSFEDRFKVNWMVFYSYPEKK